MLGKYGLRNMMSEHPRARNIIGRSILALSALVGPLYASCIGKDSEVPIIPASENQTIIQETIAPTYLTLDERYEKILKMTDVCHCYIIANENYAIVDKPSKLHDNYIIYKAGEFSSVDSQVINAEPSKSMLLTLMYGPDDDNNGLPDNKKLIMLSDGNIISDNVTSALSLYNNNPLNALNSTLQTNESEEEKFENIMRDYIKQPDRPRILVKPDFPIISQLSKCGYKTLVFQALGWIDCKMDCNNTKYDIEVYRLEPNKEAVLLKRGKSPLSVPFSYLNLLLGDNEIEVRAINPIEPHLTSSFYFSIENLGCNLGGGSGNGGGCGSGRGGGHGG